MFCNRLRIVELLIGGFTLKKGKLLGIVGLLASVSLILVGCGKKEENKTDGKVEITFINNKTDWQGDGTWDKYMKEFNEKYPNIKVKIQTITDYAGQMKTRMNSKEYGDLLMIPADISPQDYAHFFEPLGKKDELSKKYLGLNDRSFEGVQYGIPSQMNATGMLVNKKVFKEAGYNQFPTNLDDFMKAMKAIKSKTDAIPLYTNYASGWTLSNWDFLRTGVSGDKDFTNELTADKEPFAKGKTMNTIYSTLYQLAKNGLIESDPTTTDWEQSKVDFANGKIAVMVLGSWAVPQLQAANEANKKDVTFQAFPTKAADGKQYLTIGGDYNYGINKNSSKEKKKAARKLLDWLVNDSNYANDNGGISTVKGAKYPAALDDAQKAGVELIEENPAPAGKESLFADINNASEVGVGSTDSGKQRIIDAAIGNSNESFDAIMSDFNKKWASAVEEFNK